jgi:hypothetical protein
VLKNGLSDDDHNKHAVIFMSGEPPTNLPDVLLMDKGSIAVDPASPDQKLHKMSWLDSRRVHAVEHNVKVKDIGRVSKRSMRTSKAISRMLQSLTGTTSTRIRSGR